MTVNLILWATGTVLVALGYLRARGPWQRYQALKAQQANVDRYDAWRGRASATAASGPSGAEIAMAMYRRQTQIWAGVAVLGFVVLVAGFVIR
jgi:hypothetical protein